MVIALSSGQQKKGFGWISKSFLFDKHQKNCDDVKSLFQCSQQSVRHSKRQTPSQKNRRWIICRTAVMYYSTKMLTNCFPKQEILRECA